MAYEPWSVIAGETPTESKWNLLGSNDADFDSRVDQLEADKTQSSPVDGATVTFDMLLSKNFRVTIAGNRNFAVQNIQVGKFFSIDVVQGAGGGHNPTWFTGITVMWPGAEPPDLTGAVAGQVDTFVFKPITETLFQAYFAGFELQAPA